MRDRRDKKFKRSEIIVILVDCERKTIDKKFDWQRKLIDKES